MSNDSQKADQITFHYYTKLFHVVNEARASQGGTATKAESLSQSKVDKWFNLETPDSDILTKEARERLKKTISLPTTAPLEIQVLLTLPDNNNQNQALVYIAPDSSRIRIDATRKHVLLENWTLSVTRDSSESGTVALPTIYKHGIPLFRSLYSLLRILPAWKLCKRLRSRRQGAGNLALQLRIRTVDDDMTSTLGFGTPPSSSAIPLSYQTKSFPAVPYPTGSLTLSATYLSTPNFRLDELESLLSSRFLSQDSGAPEVEFVPTLVKNQQRDSMTATGLTAGSSLPSRPSIPNTGAGGRMAISPPLKAVSPPLKATTTTSLTVADRFPTSTSNITASTSSSPGTYPQPIGPLPIRRPNLNPVHPFKSNTVSSPSSFPISLPQSQTHSPRQQPVALPGTSPSSHGGAGAGGWSAASSIRHPQLSTQGSLSSLGLAGVAKFPVSSATPPSPVGLHRPSPDDGSIAPGTSASRVAMGLPARKRYSSSFGHRYTSSTGPGSDGSGSIGSGAGPGAGPGDPVSGKSDSGPSPSQSRRASASYTFSVGAIGSNDDEDISTFVQDIDERRPLSGRDRIRQQQQQHQRARTSLSRSPRKLGDMPLPPLHEREHTIRTSRPPPIEPARTTAEGHPEMFMLSPDRGVGSSPISRGFGMPPSTATSETDIDEQLKQMSDVFLKSIEGLGSGGSASGSSGTATLGRRSTATVTRGSSMHTDALGLYGTRSSNSSLATGTSASASDQGSGQHSEEVIGKLEFARPR